MKRLLTGLLLTSALTSVSWAQESSTLPLVKTDINADAEHAELCLEFDKPLNSTPARLAAALKLEMEGKSIPLPTTAVSGSSLCLFPLEHGKTYRLDVSNLRLGEDEKFSRRIPFSVPDRPASLVFSGSPDGFSSADKILSLRSVNVAQVKLEIYRITDKQAMAHAWLDRAQTLLAPSESVYIGKTKGEKIWQGDLAFDAPANKAQEKKIQLHDSLPAMAPGLYLITATVAGNGDSKSLEPLAALWLTKSDFSLRALRDSDGIHVFASRRDAPGAKTNIHLTAFNKKPDPVAEGDNAMVALTADQAGNADIAAVLAADKAGNVAFANIDALPSLSSTPAPGTIRVENPFALPGAQVGAALSLAASRTLPAGSSLLHVTQERGAYSDIPVPAVGAEGVRVAFTAPAAQDTWNLHWQKQGGALLAETSFRVTANGDAPHLELTGARDALYGDLGWSGSVKAVTSAGKTAGVTGGHVSVLWQRLDPAAFGWKDYRFGAPSAVSDQPADAGSFVSDPDGTVELHLTLPKPPQEHGLYQAVVKAVADADSGVASSAPLILPLRPDTAVVGIKPLASDAHFPQNGIARFALIGIGGDLKPRDMGDLSYQLYEEGRNFAWYQEEGRWQYKPEAQLRPIGGSDLAIKADGSSQIEWPVTAGNYRLEILDGNGKVLAQTGFSAGWDAATNDASPLNLALPKLLQAGREARIQIHLPEAATVTTVISGQHILKTIQQTFPKGENAIAFTPVSDWPDSVAVDVTAVPTGNGPILHGAKEIPLAQSAKQAEAEETGGVSIWATDDPAALVLRQNGMASLGFAIANSGSDNENWHYIFTASPGLKIESGEKGDVRLNGKQSLSLPVVVTALTPGLKEIKLEANNGKSRITRSWSLGVVENAIALKSDETAKIDPKQPVAGTAAKGRSLLIARRPMDGLAELLTYLTVTHPFTTQELGASIEALRLWNNVATQAGLIPDHAAAARRKQQIMQLLLHQNADGGFGPWRGGDSTMADTSAALTALGPDTPDQAVIAKSLAVGWLKQRLSNSWIDPKERPQRAEAYAALAAADATDPSSLHYFSDTSAQEPLPALAEADIAAAFKQARDPNAAAFWIKKMLDEHGHDFTIALLNALAATDALSSDDVHKAMAAMVENLRKGGTPDPLDVARLLHAIASDNADAGKSRISSSHDIRDVNNVLVMQANEASAYVNGDTQPLYVTYLSQGARPTHDSGVARHIYRLNGVELPVGSKSNHGDVYMVELKGSAASGGQVLLQDGGNGLRPLGCPISEKTQGLSFVPWFAPQDLTDVVSCEFSAHHMSAVLSPDKDDRTYTTVYFATIDAASTGDLPPPRMRLIK